MHMHVGFTCVWVHKYTCASQSGCRVFSFQGIYLIFKTASFDEPGAHCFG